MTKITTLTLKYFFDNIILTENSRRIGTITDIFLKGTQLIGKPECDVLLAQCAVHLARAKKSHEVYNALKAVYESIEQVS